MADIRCIMGRRRGVCRVVEAIIMVILLSCYATDHLLGTAGDIQVIVVIVCDKDETEKRLCSTVPSILRHGDYHLQGAMFG